jgi:Protein of unknown function (DUF3341)
MARRFLVATFRDPDSLLRAVRPVRAERFRLYDVYAPYPVHGLDQAMGIVRSRLPLVSLAAGLGGLCAALALQFYTNVLDWPLNVGGKPDNSTLAFIPISFELTVLFSGLATVAAFLLRARLYPGKPIELAATGVTDDVFALVLRKPAGEEAAQRARDILTECGAVTIAEKEANLL